MSIFRIACAAALIPVLAGRTINSTNRRIKTFAYALIDQVRRVNASLTKKGDQRSRQFRVPDVSGNAISNPNKNKDSLCGRRRAPGVRIKEVVRERTIK
jgi:hypothetical protein